MTNSVQDLTVISKELSEFATPARLGEIGRLLRPLEQAATDVGKAWSGSWLGHQACIYYADLRPPPPGAHFSKEWGLMGELGDTTGEWCEYAFEEVRALIFKLAHDPDLAAAKRIAYEGVRHIEDKREELLSILESELMVREDPFLERVRDQVKDAKVFTAEDAARVKRPSGTFMSRDSAAISQGLKTPPHIAVLSEAVAVRSSLIGCDRLAKLAVRAATHLRRLGDGGRHGKGGTTSIFIGHGQSPVWKDLKDFVQDRLRLPWDEFNRIPTAGVTNIERLSEMLDAAAMAFLVMTGEDELPDGSLRARMNVVHEAGLFQGRLGFKRAIVLLEDGCQEFSNIHGLEQLRFPKGNIKAVFEGIRQLLEREGIVSDLAAQPKLR
jgi:hypothetical protein